MNEVSGRDYTALFDQFVFHARRLDYKVDLVTSRELTTFAGVFDEKGRRSTMSSDEAAKRDDQAAGNKNFKPLYESTVRIRRDGDAVLPVEIVVHFADGRTERRAWDGVDRWTKLKFTRNAKVDWVQLDPEGKLLLDVDRANDSWREEPEPRLGKWGLQCEFWMQNLALWLSALV